MKHNICRISSPREIICKCSFNCALVLQASLFHIYHCWEPTLATCIYFDWLEQMSATWGVLNSVAICSVMELYHAFFRKVGFHKRKFTFPLSILWSNYFISPVIKEWLQNISFPVMLNLSFLKLLFFDPSSTKKNNFLSNDKLMCFSICPISFLALRHIAAVALYLVKL